MFSNPYYYYFKKLKHQDFGLEKKRTAEKPKRKYFLLPLELKEEEKITFKGKTYTLKKHHLSYYKLYNPKDRLITPLHYTAECTDGTKIRVHYDKSGSYLFSITSDKTFYNALSPEEKIQFDEIFKSLAKKHSKKTIDAWFNKLTKEQTDTFTLKTNLLEKLAEKSKSSTTSTTYKTLLTQTITACDKYANLTNTSTNVRDLLKQFETFLNNAANQKKSIQFSIPESKEEIDDVDNNQAGDYTTTSESKTDDASTKKQSKKCQVLKMDFTQKINQITDKLKGPQTPAIAIKNIQSLDQIQEDHFGILVQACIDGDIDIFKKHFKFIYGAPNIAGKLSELMSTCVLHKSYDIFDLVYKISQSDSVRNTFRCPFEIYPEDRSVPSSSKAISLLEIAYENNDIDFFKKLLTTYEYDPNTPTMAWNLVFQACYDSKIEFLAALLENGANSSISMKDIKYRNREITEELADLIDKLRENFKQYESYTPLIFAVATNKLPIVELLLAYNNDVDILCEDNGNKLTALFLACQNNHLGIVNALLKSNADPFIKITIKDLQCFPLLIAILNEHYAIVNSILLHINNKVKWEDLDDIYDICKEGEVKIPHNILKIYAVATHKRAKELHGEAALKMFDKAELLYREALKPGDDIIAVNTSDRNIVLLNLASCLDAQGKNLEARGDIAQALVKFKYCLAIRTEYGNSVTIKNSLDELERKILHLMALTVIHSQKAQNAPT